MYKHVLVAGVTLEWGGWCPPHDGTGKYISVLLSEKDVSGMNSSGLLSAMSLDFR